MAGLAGRRVLVTGATGFIGSHVVRRLLADGAQVYGMSKSVSSVTPVRLGDVVDQITVVEANICDRSSLDVVAREVEPEYVLHLAAFTHVGKSFKRVDENIQANIQGTVNLLQALEGRYERFVYTGTSEIYGDIPVPFAEGDLVNPVSPYSVAKYAGERYCRMFHSAYDWPIVNLRPFNAYGPWQSLDRIIPQIIMAGLTRSELKMTKGEQSREFNYVTDLADAFVAALTAPDVDGEVINVGCGEDVPIAELATRILGLLGDPIEPQLGALPYRPTEIWRMYCDNTKARELLGWQPAHDFDAGLAKTVDWYRTEYERDPQRFLARAGG